MWRAGKKWRRNNVILKSRKPMYLQVKLILSLSFCHFCFEKEYHYVTEAGLNSSALASWMLITGMYDHIQLWGILRLIKMILSDISFLLAYYIASFIFYIFSVSISDPLFSLYNSWMKNMALVIGFLMTSFIITTIILLLLHIKM